MRNNYKRFTMKKIFVLITLLGMLFVACSDDDNNTGDVLQCDLTSQIIEEDAFDEVITENYQISNVVLNQDCLEITLTSSGCDGSTWELNLYSTNAFYESLPLQRAVKLELINNEDCLAFVEKTVSFDLIPFRIEGQNEAPLNITGWEEQVIYQY